MEPEDIILSEVTQSEKDTWCALTDKGTLALKHRISMLQSTDPEKLGDQQAPREGM